jgi:hypothetical protein
MPRFNSHPFDEVTEEELGTRQPQLASGFHRN